MRLRIDRNSELFKQFKSAEGAEVIGLFYPRGSEYLFASVVKYKDYATWEKSWADMSKEREKSIDIITKQTDMFFEKIQL